MVVGPLVGLLLIGHLGSQALFLFVAGLVFFAYGGILTFIPLYAKSLGLQAETSLFFLVFALVIILTRPVIGRLFDMKGPDWTVYPGVAFFAAGMVWFSQAASLSGLLVSAAVLGVGFGALSPAFQTLAVQSAPPARAGVATATYFWSLDISVGLAAMVLSVVAAHFGICFYVWRRRYADYFGGSSRLFLLAAFVAWMKEKAGRQEKPCAVRDGSDGAGLFFVCLGKSGGKRRVS